MESKGRERGRSTGGGGGASATGIQPCARRKTSGGGGYLAARGSVGDEETRAARRIGDGEKVTGGGGVDGERRPVLGRIEEGEDGLMLMLMGHR